LNYFYDPDVYGIVVRVKMVNGDDRSTSEQFVYVDGNYCRVTKHISLEPMTETYGKQAEWEKFRPVVIAFRTTSQRTPRIRRRGSWLGCRRLEITAPPAAELHVSVVPLFESGLLSTTASHLASSARLSEVGRARPADSLSVPAVAEQLIKVIHAIEQPRRAPRLFCDHPRIHPDVQQPSDEPCVAKRDLDSQFAEITGRIELDAASTKEVRLEAKWRDVADGHDHKSFVLEAGTASTSPRSVMFTDYEPVAPTTVNFHGLIFPGTLSASTEPPAIDQSPFSLLDQFDLQCAEDKVFLGPSPDGTASDPRDKTNRFDLKDQRRKLLTVEAVAVSRFVNRFKEAPANPELRSGSVFVDVPSTRKMTAPVVSHVVPLRKMQTTGNTETGAAATTFGIRIYLRRPWFESGFGERLAVGCAIGEEAPVAGAQEIPKHITQWGEDPLERAGLRSTLRMPLASDFIACHEPAGEAVFLDTLYPPHALGGNAPVIYRDNVLLTSNVSAPRRRLSVASFAQYYDARKQLWYSDIYVGGDFFGWCGLALYRHQPNALPERELSETWNWAYAAVLYGDPVAWVARDGTVHVTIGPVYDPNVSFEFDSLDYRDGVSRDVSTSSRALKPLRHYRVNKATYFEGVLPKQQLDWSLLKKRFNFSVGSRTLTSPR